MKKKSTAIFLISLSIICCQESFAQRFRQQSYLQFGSGFSDIGPVFNARYIYRFQSQLSGQIGAGYTFGKVADASLNTFFIDGIGVTGFFEKGKSVYISAIYGLSIATDVLNGFVTEKIDNRVFFTFGVLGGIQAEFKIQQKISFIIHGSQRHYFKDTFDEKTNWRFVAGVGIRYSI